MINVKELNKIALEEIGVQNIGYIAEADVDDGDWNCYAAPDEASAFGFSEEKGFRPDTSLYWDHYVVEPSVSSDNMVNIVLVGYGPAYEED